MSESELLEKCRLKDDTGGKRVANGDADSAVFPTISGNLSLSPFYEIHLYHPSTKYQIFTSIWIINDDMTLGMYHSVAHPKDLTHSGV